jgi:hypothetical protein
MGRLPPTMTGSCQFFIDAAGFAGALKKKKSLLALVLWLSIESEWYAFESQRC